MSPHTLVTRDDDDQASIQDLLVQDQGQDFVVQDQDSEVQDQDQDSRLTRPTLGSPLRE